MPRFVVSRELSDPRRGLLALREGSERHPMAMFFIIVALAFAAAALLSPSRAAFPSFGGPGLSDHAASGKTSRLAAVSEADIACRGQAWGAESEACLEVIARESGRGEGVRIRLVAADTRDASTPNVF
jgi:hypothetical protein